ncbi:thymidylate kinase [Streptosporangium sp. NPDC051022]|uniref:thymidylate kinase n=1 Tax=Streptosporangium sp. NPDC051022 TaxID=3155752 RepID=UPI0034362D62
MTATMAWVSVEGLNGVGKTHLIRQVAAVLEPACVPLVELPDAPPDLLSGRVIAALRQNGDLFLRTGTPRTETLLLMALQVHRHECLGDTGTGRVVLEDRGPHTVALYQAAILTPDGDDERALQLAEAILTTIGAWRPLPDLTVLLRDDPARCLVRFEQRIGRPARADERTLMERVDRLYERFAAAYPQRMSLLDRRDIDESGLVAAIAEACRTLIDLCTGPVAEGGIPCVT